MKLGVFSMAALACSASAVPAASLNPSLFDMVPSVEETASPSAHHPNLTARLAEQRFPGCSQSQVEVIVAAAKSCKEVAFKAFNFASETPAKVEHYFKASDPMTINRVKGVYQLVVQQCDWRGPGQITCVKDDHETCPSTRLALTSKREHELILCPSFFSRSCPLLSSKCHKCNDQTTTLIHEITHFVSVRNSRDVAYGYDDIMDLTPAEASANADTFAYFANDAYINSIKGKNC